MRTLTTGLLVVMLVACRDADQTADLNQAAGRNNEATAIEVQAVEIQPTQVAATEQASPADAYLGPTAALPEFPATSQALAPTHWQISWHCGPKHSNATIRASTFKCRRLAHRPRRRHLLKAPQTSVP